MSTRTVPFFEMNSIFTATPKWPKLHPRRLRPQASLTKNLLMTSSVNICRYQHHSIIRRANSIVKMPKSAIDATRFTSTTPHATTKPPPASSATAQSLPPRQPQHGPPGETPLQKVARLREAAARARAAKLSRFDRMIIVGRAWADRAHHVTAMSLIGLTGTWFPVSASAHVCWIERNEKSYEAD